MRFIAVLLGVVTAAATAGIVVFARSGSMPGLKASSTSLPAARPTTPSTRGLPSPRPGAGGTQRTLAGVVTNNLYNFQKTTATYPSLTATYIWWGRPFPASKVFMNHRLGAKTLVVLEPEHVSMMGIAAGHEDAYLKQFARAEHGVGVPVLLSFAPEANGAWYPWGAHHISPDLYIAMWRHVHDVIMANGGSKITWLWQTNVPWPQSEPMHLLWPGKKFVNEVGIDGQLKARGSTFASIFEESLNEVRAFTNKPIMLSEVSVKPDTEAPQKIANLFAGACRQGLTAVILFDLHQEWQFDNVRGALPALKQAATTGCRVTHRHPKQTRGN